MRLIAIAVCALALIPAAVSAQQSPRAATAGPTIRSAAVGIQPAVENDGVLSAQGIFSPGQGRDVALMVVGGAAMIAGAIIGGTAGTIFLIGGAAIALYGLYNYLE